MKKQILFLLVAVFAMTIAVVAQTQPKQPRPTAKSRAEQMAADFNLSETQTQQVQALFEEQLAKNKELKATPPSDPIARREELKALRKGWDQQLEGIIGIENMAKNKAMMAEKARLAREAKAAKAAAEEKEVKVEKSEQE